MMCAGRASPRRLFPRARARAGLLWNVAASFPHLFDVTQRSKFFPGNFLDHEIASVALFAKAAYGHAAMRECKRYSILQTQRGIWRYGRLYGCAVRHQPLIAFDVAL